MKRILYLTDDGLTLFLVEGGTLRARRHYPGGEEGRTAFRLELEAAPELVSRLVLDIAGEEFQVENLPHLFSRDQHRMLERRIRQRFRGLRWTYSERQGRESGGRRDDRFLVSAVVREAALEPWLAAIQEVGVPLEAITSVPLISSRLYRRMHLQCEHVLFVTLGARGGIRQIYLQRGRLEASRLAPTARQSDEASARDVLAEVRRMQQYLTGARLLSYGDTLDVFLLADNAIVALVGREIADADGLRLHTYHLGALAERFRFRGVRRNRDVCGFFAVLAAELRHPPSYAHKEELTCHRLLRLRLALERGAVAAVLGGVVAGGWLLSTVMEQRQQLDLLAGQIRHFETLAQRLRRSVEENGVTGFQMADAARFEQDLKPLLGSPFQPLSVVGQVLLSHDSVRLDHLKYRWPDFQPAPPDVPAQRPVGPVIELEGRMQAAGRSYRILHQEFEQLLDDLREEDRFASVQVKRWPLQMRPDHPLKLTDLHPGEREGVPFILRLEALQP